MIFVFTYTLDRLFNIYKTYLILGIKQLWQKQDRIVAKQSIDTNFRN